MRKLGAIVLEAGQNGKIALIHQLAAETPDVAGASLLLLLRTAMSKRASRDRDRQQDERDEELLHFVDSFRLQTLSVSLGRNAVHSITIAWSLSPAAGALRS